MNIDGGGTLVYPNSKELVSLEWLEPASPQVDLGAANILICPTCRSNQTNATTKWTGEQECPICFDTMKCQTLECGHAICDTCWKSWKQVCMVGFAFVPPSLNMEEIEEERSKIHDTWKESLPYVWNGTGTEEGCSKGAERDLLMRTGDVVAPLLDDVTKDLSNEADRLSTFYHYLLVVPTFLLLLDVTVKRVFKNTPNIAAMKVFVDVFEIRMDDLYQLSVNRQGETEAKEIYRLRHLSRLNHLIGEAYEDMDNPHASIPYYTKAAQLADETGDNKLVGTMYNDLGLNQKRCDLYSLAEKSYEKAMNVPEINRRFLKTEKKKWTGTSGKLTPHC